ncbi:hypothetical protein HOY82DRAFT_478530 [Tuber indicum]|nr:hypothetical protein HOY82DRAFT_478530 [Tuber indicum]
MSGHRAGGGPSYLRDLNMLPEEEIKADAEFDPSDLSLYTNTEFFEFDIGEGDGGQEGGERFTVPEEAQLKNGHLGFLNDDDFDYMPFPTLPTSESQPSTQTTITSSHQASNFMPPTATHRAIQPSSASSDSASPPPLSPRSGKRKASIAATPPSTDGLDDLSRVAAEEDKRRRNTAASARFRVKKKQREQALERTAKEMTDRVTQLESKIAQLEMENKWLKNLIVEKNTATATSNDSDNSRESSKDGAGTKVKNSES